MKFGKYAGYTALICGDCNNIWAVKTWDSSVKCSCGCMEPMWAEDYRVCSECGALIQEGYVVQDNDAYYCSDKCMKKHFAPADERVYWSNWE